MKRTLFGGALPKVLALIFCVALIFAYWNWKAHYGVIGHVDGFDFAPKDYIAFMRQDASGHTNVFAVKADGTSEKQLTDDAYAKSSVDWSPDGKQIVYCAEVADEKYRAFQLFLLGKGDSRQLTHGTGSKSLPKWRADGKQIAYIVGGTLKVIDPNGDNAAQIYPPPHKGGKESEDGKDKDADETSKKPPLSTYQWSPVGQMFACTQILEGDDVQTMGSSDWWQKSEAQKKESEFASIPEPETLLLIPGTDVSPILRGDTNSVALSFGWFPDGERLAVAVSTRGGSHAIMIIRVDEQPSNNHQMAFVSKGNSIEAQNPVVSPDGSKIAVEMWKIDSSESRELLGIAVLSTTPGATVGVLGRQEIAKIDPFLKIKGKTTNPKWSPDGSKLLYQVTNDIGKRDIFVTNADGSNPINLSKGRGDNNDASWAPVK